MDLTKLDYKGAKWIELAEVRVLN